jgi:hypothetical protein
VQADPDRRHRKLSSSSFYKLINTSNRNHILITSLFIFQNLLFYLFKTMSQKLVGERFHDLKKAWLQYVHEEKEKQGEVGPLPKARRCRCDKSLTSYPHWPPTTYEEAIAQLNCLIGESYTHRPYLADCLLIRKNGEGFGRNRRPHIVDRRKLPKLQQESKTTGQIQSRLPENL